jgi:hypothetical protein
MVQVLIEYILFMQLLRKNYSYETGLFGSLIGHVDGVRLLRTVATNGPIVHPPHDM